MISKTSLKKVFSPPLMGFLLGLVMVMLQIKLPAFLASDLQYLGNLTTPLSMIFIGLSVSHVGAEAVGSGKRSAIDSTRSLPGCPSFDGFHRLLVASSKPDEASLYHPVCHACGMTNAPVVARLYGADSDYAAVMVTETTLGNHGGDSFSHAVDGLTNESAHENGPLSAFARSHGMYWWSG